MAGSLNKVMLMGNVTRDPEIKYTPKGSAVTDLGLAMNRVVNPADGGERREEVTFVDVELWGRTAEIAGEFAKKGQKVLIEGRLRMDSWEDKQSGQKRSRLKVVGETLHLLGGRGGGGQGGGGGDYEADAPPAKGFSSKPPSQPKPAPRAEDEPDDIPF